MLGTADRKIAISMQGDTFWLIWSNNKQFLAAEAEATGFKYTFLFWHRNLYNYALGVLI